MRSERVSLKKIISKKIEERRLIDDKISIKKNSRPSRDIVTNSMNNRDISRSSEVPFVDTSSIDRRARRNINVNSNQDINNITYYKKVWVDYDIVIAIPSFNRYDKIVRLLKQFYNQKTKYSFKIILLNDGSTDDRYDKIINNFPDIIYLKNDKPNGKAMHWYCYNQMWAHLIKYKCHAVLQMDDDFILSDLFLDNIIDLFFNKKEENGNIMAIAPHLWSFKKVCEEGWWRRNDFVDGIALIDIDVIEQMNYVLKPVNSVEVMKSGATVRVWSQISEGIIKNKCIIYRTDKSLVYHDGNDDSKLHGDVRKDNKGGVYTQKYIGGKV